MLRLLRVRLGSKQISSTGCCQAKGRAMTKSGVIIQQTEQSFRFTPASDRRSRASPLWYVQVKATTTVFQAYIPDP